MSMLDRINEIFFDFQNFPPKSPIVRNGIVNDAYSIYVFETLFSFYHKVRKFSSKDQEHREILLASIVPPPDDSIDIFFELDELDERTYHIVQVKNSVVRPAEIEAHLSMMEKTIGDYFKNPKSTRRNLKEVIMETEFAKEDRVNCHYYFVHNGNTKKVRNQKKNQTILNFTDLELISKGMKNECVPFAEITIDTKNNFIINNFIDNKEHTQKNFNNKPKSLLCNFNGYDLAKLNNEYASTLAGRNILYGQNLREALMSKSKTYESMFQTINIEPELFLFYNNGITILCSEFDAKTQNNVEKIKLKNFSIINGAQTTSTLGDYLKESASEEDQAKIENLKKVFVLTKIYEINATLKEHEKIGESIKIFTNTQTPLSNRDMVSIRSEQIKLQRRFLEDFSHPNIFISIKNGESVPSHPPLFKHQIITNERLAQLCFAGPLLEPFIAKDKRSKLFNVDQQEGVTLNSLYHKVFDTENGKLFEMSNLQVDELLFIYKLHEDTKKFHKTNLKNQLLSLNQDPIIDEIDRNTRQERKDIVKRYQEIASVYIFHNIAGYYALKRKFDPSITNSNKLIFNSRLYYNDRPFRQQVIELFFNLIYIKSLKIVADNSGIGNIQNWTRSLSGAETYLRKLNEEITLNSFQYDRDYKHFISLSKCLV